MERASEPDYAMCAMSTVHLYGRCQGDSMLQRAKMAGNMLALFALIFSVFCVFPSLSERASFRQQESYMGDVGTRGKEVELQFKGNECLRKVLEEIVSSCKDGQQIAG